MKPLHEWHPGALLGFSVALGILLMVGTVALTVWAIPIIEAYTYERRVEYGVIPPRTMDVTLVCESGQAVVTEVTDGSVVRCSKVEE